MRLSPALSPSLLPPPLPPPLPQRNATLVGLVILGEQRAGRRAQAQYNAAKARCEMAEAPALGLGHAK